MYKFKDIIEEVEERNTDLRYGLDDIVGVTIEKGLIPTVANLAQTSLEKFYIVKPETFVYNPRTHGVRLGMGFNNTTNIYITSWNNVAFRIKKEAQNIVIPYYLWLFFCRPIWDRLTNFLAWGSSTIVFAWKDFLNIDIVLPSIEYQREIVSEYETLTNRIRLNNQMIQNLEDTAQALYRKTFVDNIDKENLPEGWRIGTLGELCEKTIGGDWGKDIKVDNYISEVFCIRGADIPYISRGMKNSMPIRFILEKNLHDRKIKSGDIIIEISGGSPTQSTGRSVFITDDILNYANKSLICSNFCRLIIVQEYYKTFVFASIQHLYVNDVLFRLENSSNGVKNLDLSALLNDEEMIIPSNEIAKDFSKSYLPLLKNIYLFGQEIELIKELQSLLLAKMGQ